MINTSNPLTLDNQNSLFNFISDEIAELQIQLDSGQGLEMTLRQSLSSVQGGYFLLFLFRFFLELFMSFINCINSYAVFHINITFIRFCLAIFDNLTS